MTKAHTDRSYEGELHDLRERLLLMGGRVEEMIAQAAQALATRDAAVARTAKAADRAVNRDEIEVDEMCLEILARRQPMASDLRFIALAFKMVTDLERIGDLAVDVCERAVKVGSGTAWSAVDDLATMTGVVRSMVRGAMESFADGDGAKARAVLDRDDDVDARYTAVAGEVVSLMRIDAAFIEPGMHVHAVARYLERIADHAVNVAEHVILWIEKTDVRHVSKKSLE
jgi:phosphate transport system protein